MSEVKNDGGPAFPCEGGDLSGLYAASGMSLRDYFAIHCDQPGEIEIVAAAGCSFDSPFSHVIEDGEGNSHGHFNEWWRKMTPARRFELYAKVRYALADAMLAAREPRP